jgi:hypothetical protein
MYFKALPKMFYPYGDTKTVVPDIFRRVHLDKYFQNRLHLQEYYISDQESPEIVADKFYGSSKYHWLVIIANNIVDVKREWPLSNNSLVAYCDEKYGEGNRTAVHHYVMTEDKTVIVDWDATLVANGSYQAVTNLEYETGLNDAKRQILLLHKQFLRDITAQYLRLVK